MWTVLTADTTDETLTQLLLDRVRELDLDPAHIVGQGYALGARHPGAHQRTVSSRCRRVIELHYSLPKAPAVFTEQQ